MRGIFVDYFSVIQLPFTDGDPEEDEYEDLSKKLSRMSNPLSSISIKMTKAAIAGIHVAKLKSFQSGVKIFILLFVVYFKMFSINKLCYCMLMVNIVG